MRLARLQVELNEQHAGRVDDLRQAHVRMLRVKGEREAVHDEVVARAREHARVRVRRAAVRCRLVVLDELELRLAVDDELLHLAVERRQ